jgi:predicted nucleic acid-binding protein
MSNGHFSCVIDANVALKLFITQTLSDRADVLFAYMESDAQSRFYVPDFFYAECASVLVNYVYMKKHPAARAKQDIEDLEALSLRIVPTTPLISIAATIALNHRISGYDALYVAVSAHISAPLITADEKLIRAIQNTPYQVQSLATFEIPSH